MIHPKYFILAKSYIFLSSYAENKIYLTVVNYKEDKDTYISNAKPDKGVNLLYEGSLLEIPDLLYKKYFLGYENGDGYWHRVPENRIYHTTIISCYGDDFNFGKSKVLELFQKELETPIIFIFEMI